MKTLNVSMKKNYIYNIIRHKILTQEFKSGETLQINQLAINLNVSSTPIREALILLEKENLVNFHPNTSPTVCVLNSKIFRNSFDTVLVLLLGSYEFCITNSKRTLLIENMKKAITKQKEIMDTASDYDFIQATLDFDDAIISSTGNNQLMSIFHNTLGLLTLICMYDYKKNNVDRYANIKEHEAILNAIKANDHDNARNFLQQHYARSIVFSDSF